MGLDMYLEKRHYIANHEGQKKEEQHNITIKKGGLIRKDIDNKKIKSIITEVMYWRKTNCIHNWFVKNVQKGIDDCKQYYVHKEDLDILLKIINKVLKDKTLAPKLLPTQEGFFFGGTDYDEWYFKDLIETAKVLEKELDKEDIWSDYYYQSNW